MPAPGAPPPPLPNIAILSYEFWQRRYGGDESIVGKSIEFGNGRADIVGVLAPRFELLFPPGTNVDPRPDIIVANRVNYETGSRNNVFLRVVAKLKPGVTFEQAQSELDRLSADLRARFPIKQTANSNLRIEPMHEDLVADVRPQLVALMGAVVFVLLIACANVANLLLVRASARERELAVRAAIGGNRWRIIRQLVAESVVLAAIGGAAGLLLAQFGIDALIQLSPEGLPRATAVSLDGTVLAFAALASFAAALIFGVLPAWKASRPDVMDVLRSSGRLVGGSSGRWLRDGAVIAEVALAFVLLVGSGLMIRTFMALQNANPGFDPDNVMTFLIQNNRAQGAGGARGVPADDARTAEGGAGRGRCDVRRADSARRRQLAGALRPARRRHRSGEVPAGDRALRAAGILRVREDADHRRPRVHRGRQQSGREGDHHRRADGGAAVPERQRRRPAHARARHDARARDVRGDRRRQTPAPHHDDERRRRRHVLHGRLFAVRRGVPLGGRTSGDPNAITGAVRSALAQQDPRLLLTEPRTWRSYLDEHVAPTRFALILIGVFAGVAAILAMIGLYGVLATTVRQRTTEIGVRMAFGATQGSILSLIIGQGLRLSIGGIVLGVIAAIALTRVMASLLVGVTATDPVTFVAMAVIFTLVAAFAAWIPARRAAALNPNVALQRPITLPRR